MRKLASIQVIKEIKPHPNADRLEIAMVLGWQCVVKKGEFKPKDKCIYFEIDSLIPMEHEWIKFLQNKDRPEKPARLKTIKLRGKQSQGLCMPLKILAPAYMGREHLIKEGEDVTEFLGVTKYEPPIPACLSGDVKGARPSYTIYTDELRLQSFPELIKEFQGKLVYISQKIDGTSGTFVYKDGEKDVCGRNWSYKEDDKNTYWKVAKKYDLISKLKAINEETGVNYCVQAECYGEGIQKNRLKIKGQDLAVFNVMNINGRRFLGFYEFKEFCERLQLPIVPIIKICKFEWETIDELLELAKGTYKSGEIQEGIVIRPVHPFNSKALNSRASFKVINNTFLLNGGD